MAHYTRFEIYIPVIYTSQRDDKKHAIDDELLEEFIDDVTTNYGGLTQANPLAPALYRGWWRDSNDPARSPATIDHLTYLL